MPTGRLSAERLCNQVIRMAHIHYPYQRPVSPYPQSRNPAIPTAQTNCKLYSKGRLADSSFESHAGEEKRGSG